MSFCRADAFRERPTSFAGELSHEGWRLKLYDISHDGSPVEQVFGDAMPLALTRLPQPAVATDRPGVGFVIRHQGPEWQYLVLCWWDSQNELVQRIFVRPRIGPDAAWRPAATNQSICVFDLDVIWFERNAFITHVLRPESGPDLDAYLAARFVATDRSMTAFN